MAIYYRIPTQFKGSMLPLWITEFCSDMVGDQALFPEDIVVMTDSDFDFDTANIFNRYFEVLVEEGKKTIQGYDIDDYPSMKKDKRGRTIALKNEMFDMAYAAITGYDALQQIFMPGAFQEIIDVSYKIELYRNGVINDREYMDSLSSDELADLYFEHVEENMDAMMPDTELNLFLQNITGKRLIVFASVGMIGHNVLSNFDTKIRIKLPFVFDSNVIEGNVLIDGRTDIEGNLQSRNVGETLGASTDCVKEPALARANVNLVTYDMLQSLMRIGFSKKQALFFVGQPVVRELVDKYNVQKIENPNLYVTNVIDMLEEEMAPGEVSITTYVSTTPDGMLKPQITMDDLIQRLINDSEGESLSVNEQEHMMRIDINILEIVRSLNDISRDIGGLTQNITRYSSINNGPRVSIGHAEEKNDQYESLVLEMSSMGTKYPGMSMEVIEDKMPILSTRMKLQSEALTNLREVFRTYGANSFVEARNELKRMFGDRKLPAEVTERLAYAYYIYKLVNDVYIIEDGEKKIYPAVINLSDKKTRDRYYRDFPGWFMENVKYMAGDNKFLENIYIRHKNNKSPVDYISTDLASAKGSGRQLYIDDWAEMLFSDDDNVARAAVDLWRYWVLRSPDSFSSSTPIHLTPVSVYMVIPGGRFVGDTMRSYEHDYRWQDAQIDVNKFLPLFLLNNMNNKALVPQIDLTAMHLRKQIDAGVYLDESNTPRINENLSDPYTMGYNKITNVGRFSIGFTKNGQPKLYGFNGVLRRGPDGSVIISNKIVDSPRGPLLITNSSLKYCIGPMAADKSIKTGQIIVHYRTLSKRGIDGMFSEYWCDDIMDDSIFDEYRRES